MFEKTEIIEKDLPNPEEIFKKLLSIKDIGKGDYDLVRKYALTNTETYLKITNQFLKINEYLESPEIVLKKLEWYYYILGGLQGLLTALAEKGLELELKATSKIDDGKKGPTAADREKYAKGQIADLKGALATLDVTEKLLTSKMFTARGDLRKGF